MNRRSFLLGVGTVAVGTAVGSYGALTANSASAAVTPPPPSDIFNRDIVHIYAANKGSEYRSFRFTRKGSTVAEWGVPPGGYVSLIFPAYEFVNRYDWIHGDAGLEMRIDHGGHGP